MEALHCGAARGATRWLVQATLLLSCLTATAAAEPSPAAGRARESALTHPTATALRVAAGPVIDGRLDDAVWAAAPLLPAMRQLEPIADGEPTFATEIRIVRDDEMIYFGVRCYDDDPAAIIANVMQRDQDLTQDDRIGIVLDTNLDRRSSYFFEVNPNGARWDGLFEPSGGNFNWDGIWLAKARVDAQGWTVEIAIPFKTLSFDPKQDRWGINILRGVRRLREQHRWASPHPRFGFAQMSTAGFLEGMRGAEQGRGLDIVPASTARYVNDPVEFGAGEYTRWDPSIDIFYHFTPTLTGVATVNTDFGDAEVDARQVNTTRFPLFFPERRDFFLQDAGVFDFADRTNGANARPFFSRRIGLSQDGEVVGLIAGAKLTGRIGPLNLGLLNAQVAKQDFADVGARNLSVARASLNLFEESTLGVIGTFGDPDSNREAGLVGVDFNYRKSDLFGDKTVVANLWYQHSESEGVSGKQEAFGARVEYPNDRWLLRWTALQVQENFDPALGRVDRTGIQSTSALARYRYRPGGVLRFIDATMEGLVLADTEDTLANAEVGWTLSAENQIGDRVSASVFRFYERIDGAFSIAGNTIDAGSYETWRGELLFGTTNARKLDTGLRVNFGEAFDGHRVDIVPSLNLRPTPWLRFSALYTQNYFDLPQRDFRVQIASVRLVFQPTADLFWSTLVQWDNASDSIGVQSRVRWIVRPGNEITVVFNQDVLDVDEDPRRGRSELLSKVSWTFRF